MEKAMEAEAASVVKRMNSRMGILDTMITAAPLVGILGTVLGIITAFNMLSSSDIDDPQAVMGGIIQALITTAAGLAIAIITVFPYNYFNSRIDYFLYCMEKYATSLEVVYERLRASGEK